MGRITTVASEVSSSENVIKPERGVQSWGGAFKGPWVHFLKNEIRSIENLRVTLIFKRS